MVGLAWELGYIIALPLLILLLLGKYLDERYGTDPWLKIAGFIIAITATILWLTRRFREIRKLMNTNSSKELK
ncbi:MAG: hypothetical protein A2722_03425 [Candidatus Doudnabacteria bacterium RIFCSPHIGHO2_01_FULL_50_11]|uniref:F0F1 ATP synthase subunit n=1 Tax=Candidatus Doudnabacteria bacterium RIFCSPHIGHO2_01_FULL_50_11 TaxID=1817828 RepID=A0A1F5PIL0_9BACT|nr:MAG: hypothetical protein A2722_03425 [Candidatus Doudnabacteria bacterium RIFCSPHIGHO2_01_FULL_50_11]